MKKILALLALIPALLLGAPQNVQKDGGALTGSFTVPTGVSITATGTGTISATSVTGLSVASGKTLTVNNSLTLAGTDGTTMTFPGTSATVARTDAGQTFTGTQTFGALVATTLNGNTFTTGTGTLTIAAGKTLTASNTLTFTGTDGSSVAFGTGGTVAYTASSVASIAGTANQIAASAATGAVTLSLAGPHNFTSLTSTAVLLGGGTSAVNASDLTYSTPTLSVPTGFTISAAGSVFMTLPSGANNVSVVPGTTGYVGVNNTGGSASLLQIPSSFASFRVDQGILAVFGYNTNTQTSFLSGPGTVATPTAATSGWQIGSIQWASYNGSAYSYTADVRAYTQEAWTGSAQGSYLVFSTTALGATSRTDKVKINAAGGLLVANTTFDGATSPMVSVNLSGLTPYTTAQPAGDSQTSFRSFGLAGTQNSFVLHAYNAYPVIAGAAANGTAAVPTATTTDLGLRLGMSGYTGTAWGFKAEIDILASETWSSTANGTYMSFHTTPSGTTSRTEYWQILGDGSLRGLNSAKAAGFQLYNTTDLTNYERIEIFYSSNIARIRSSSGGSGTSRGLQIIGPNNAAFGTFAASNQPWSFDGVTSSSTGLVGFNVTVTSTATSGTIRQVYFTPTYNQASGTAVSTDVSAYRTQTAVGSGAQKGLDLGVGSTSWYAFAYGNTATTGGFNSSSTVETAVTFSPIINQTSTAGYTAFKVNVTETGTGSGAKLLEDLQVGGTSKWKVSNSGDVTLGGTALITKPGGTIPLVTTNTAITDGAGASLGTLTNAPAAGNPTKWIKLVDDNGTARYVPAW